MYICVECRKEMQCEKNGVGADFGNGHVYAGDIHYCPLCGIRVLATNKTAYYDPDHNMKQDYLRMRTEP